MSPRTPAVSIASLPGALPRVNIGPDTNHSSIAESIVEHLPSLQASDLCVDALWRDLFAFTGTLRTFYGSELVSSTWADLCGCYKPSGFALTPKSSQIVQLGPEISWIQALFTFRVEGGQHRAGCSGIIGLVPDTSGDWKIWMISTILEKVDGWPDVDALEPYAVTNGSSGAPATPDLSVVNDTTNGVNGHINGSQEKSDIPCYDCVVVGAGMAGLSLAGRLKALGVSALTIERNERIGDNWAFNRYATFKLHTSKEMGQLPFGRVYGPEDPYFLPSKVIARGYQDFVKQYNINVWLSTNLGSASWDADENTWTLNVTREGEKMRIHARHLVFAIGAGGQNPKMPDWPDREKFKGIVLHSVDYHSRALNAPTEWKGKAGVIIGTGNTAHDVAEDMLDAGLSSVTMVQRNRTAVITARGHVPHFDRSYNIHIPTETADRLSWALPNSIIRLSAIEGIRASALEELSLFSDLERAGFKADPFCDLYSHILERLGGHYLNMGASEKIVEGRIKMKSDAAVAAFTDTGLKFTDGSELKADVVVFCTGFDTDLRKTVAGIVGEEIGEKLEDWWCVDAEGELRGAWKPIGHPAIFYTGGTIPQSRFFSRFLAMQIKANLEGVPFEVYNKAQRTA